ncbi:hypothetical protein [Edaphobacter aggregans]|uniref:hypothetical protein n=1 Tax=Edaphobacter aggregans TaxID=570835 RepID=UPI0012FBB67C|nr:hypothetical protein [Edaphobacter aggregans]
MTLSECDHASEETEYVLIRLQLTPVKPSRFVVLVIGIVVTELGVHEFVPCPEHWDPIRQKQQTAKVFNLLSAEREHLGRYGFIPFMTTVPTVVFIHSILIVVTILRIVFAVIGDKVIQGEAVV